MSLFEFQITKQVNYGQALYFISSQQNWDPLQAIRMECINCSKWSVLLRFNQTVDEYKYMIGNFDEVSQSGMVWEQGSNRSIKSIRMSRQKCMKVRQIKDVWEERSVMLILRGRCRNSKVFVFGDYQCLTASKQMKQGKYGQHYFLYANLELKIGEDPQDGQIQYYIIEFGQNIVESISRQIKTMYDSSINVMYTHNPQFTRSLIL